MPDFARRAHLTELMDDDDRPRHEFDDAYRELASINRRLGGLRAIRRFLPSKPGGIILDVAAGGCDIGDALMESDTSCRVVSLDLNAFGLARSRRTLPVIGDGLMLPFADAAFDAVICSLSFHHLKDEECVRVLAEMWRTSRGTVIVNDLHRHRLAYVAIRALSLAFSKSVMVKHDGPVSVLRAFQKEDLREIARLAKVPARVYRSFPYRLVLVAHK